MAKKSVKSARRSELIFYYCLIALPLLQFLIFYVGINFNSILLSFKEYRVADGKEYFIWVKFDQYVKFAKEISLPGSALFQMTKNSLFIYAFGFCTGLPLALIFSFYIYKNCFASEFFRILLFVPSIISSVVTVFMFKYAIDKGFTGVIEMFVEEAIEPPLASSKNHMWAVLFYNFLVGFGTNVLIYSSAMTRIPVSIAEYAQLDGVKPMREFFSITIPLIWPTIATFVVIGVSGIFTNQANLYAMFSKTADISVQTFGYYLFILTGLGETQANYPFAAAAGIIFTLIAVPLTLGVRKLFDILDPCVSY